MSELNQTDPDVYNAIKGEEERELSKIVLIASENNVSNAVLEAQGSVFTNKYAEGYPTAATTAGVSLRTRWSCLQLSGQSSSSGGARECAAAFWFPGKHGSVLQRSQARRHDPRHGAPTWRTFNPRGKSLTFRAALQVLFLRRGQTDRTPRLRRSWSGWLLSTSPK